jgi:hypothetical protein
LFRPVRNVPAVAINLHTVNSDGTTNLADGVLAQFRNDFSRSVDQYDALKFTNINETFAILDNNNAFILERRPIPTVNDTIFLSLKRTRQLNYRFNFIPQNITGGNLNAYLVDSYKKTSTPLSMQGDTWFNFSVTGDAASAAANRFYVIFKRAVRFHHINADMVVRDVAVNWTTEGDADVVSYEVERSSDGVSFERIAAAVAKENSREEAYSSLDLNPAPGIYYYRVKGICASGAYGYTEAVKVKVATTKSQLYVYPNPVTDGVIAIQMNTLPEGAYNVKLVNTTGQVLLNNKIQHVKNRATETVSYPSSVTAGTYQLEVTGPDKTTSVVSVVIVKQ